MLNILNVPWIYQEMVGCTNQMFPLQFHWGKGAVFLRAVYLAP